MADTHTAVQSRHLSDVDGLMWRIGADPGSLVTRVFGGLERSIDADILALGHVGEVRS